MERARLENLDAWLMRRLALTTFVENGHHTRGSDSPTNQNTGHSTIEFVSVCPESALHGSRGAHLPTDSAIDDARPYSGAFRS